MALTMALSALGQKTLAASLDDERFPKTEKTPVLCFTFLTSGPIATSSRLQKLKAALPKVGAHTELHVTFSKREMRKLRKVLDATAAWNLDPRHAPQLMAPDPMGQRTLRIYPRLLADLMEVLPEFKHVTTESPRHDDPLQELGPQHHYIRRASFDDEAVFLITLLDIGDEVGSLYTSEELSGPDLRFLYSHAKNWYFKLHLVTGKQSGLLSPLVSSAQRESFDLIWEQLIQEVTETRTTDRHEESRLRDVLNYLDCPGLKPHELRGVINNLYALNIKFTGPWTNHAVAKALEHAQAQLEKRDFLPERVMNASAIWQQAIQLAAQQKLFELVELFRGRWNAFPVDTGTERGLRMADNILFIEMYATRFPRAATVLLMHRLSGGISQRTRPNGSPYIRPNIIDILRHYARMQLQSALRFARVNPHQPAHVFVTRDELLFLGEFGDATDLAYLEELKTLTLVHADAIHETSSHDRIHTCCDVHSAIQILRDRLQRN